MGINLYPEYKDYNEVTVKILDYVVSNINTKSNVGDISNVQLQSLSIKGAVIGSQATNPSQTGASGTVTLADYKHTIYNLLTSNFQKYVNRNKDNNPDVDLFPSIDIKISAYTGTITFSGVILDWNASFSGALVTVTINWGVYKPKSDKTKSGSSGNIYAVSGLTYNTPYDIVKKAKEVYGDQNIDFVYICDDKEYKDSNINSQLQFYEPVTVDLVKSPSTGNLLIDCYRVIVDNAVTSDAYPVYGEISNNKYIVRSANKSEAASNTDNSKSCSDVVFVLNGKYLPYSQVNGKLVIPLMSFNANFNFKEQNFQGDINGNFNGTVISDNTGTWLSTDSVDGAARTQSQVISNHFFDKITFECLNTVIFENYNTHAQLHLEIFDERGVHIPELSMSVTPTECDYELNGAVVKASVTCTNLFSDNKIKTGAENNPPSNEERARENVNNDKPKEQLNDLVTYLKSEDDFTVSLNYDGTKPNTSTFYDLVDEFIKLYGHKTSTNRNLDFEFVEKIHNKKQYGLLVLLMAAANYGVTRYTDKWKSDDFIDPVMFFENGKPINKIKFGASTIGKMPFAYAEGGIGIAHFDSGSLIDIYTTIGFDPDEVDTKEKRDHFNDILTYDHRIVDWKTIVITSRAGISNGIKRIVPVFKKGKNKVKVNGKDVAYYRFFAQLKNDTAWKNWAKAMVNYVVSDNDKQCYPFQRMMFDLWITKYWQPTINKLKTCAVQPGHAVSLQDAVRISRAGNSEKGYINKSCGKNVAEQFVIYRDMQSREIKQKAFCRRCANIISWLVRKMV